MKVIRLAFKLVQNKCNLGPGNESLGLLAEAAKKILEVGATADVFVTPGGTLKVLDFKALKEARPGPTPAEGDYKRLAEAVTKTVLQPHVFPLLEKSGLSKAVKYLTLGIDLYEEGEGPKHAEMVAVIDIGAASVVAWTGKSYPVQSQAASLVYCPTVDSHFMRLAGEEVLVLGCHDLNVFSNRAKAVSKGAGRVTYKAKLQREFSRMAKAKGITTILHHPHHTYSPRVWNTAWSGAREDLATLRTGATGLNIDGNGNPTQDPRKICNSTAFGDVRTLLSVGGKWQWLEHGQTSAPKKATAIVSQRKMASATGGPMLPPNAKPDWNKVGPEHIRAAVHAFESDPKVRPSKEARNTVLVVGGKNYPAKFIRGLAYQLATGKALNPSIHYSGGSETQKHLERLGFKVIRS
jgi:hypothetical protein